MILASIPSPPQGEWHLGPVPLRAYAIAILIGGIVAWWILDRRYTAKGGPKDTAIDVVFWMVPFGIIGARLYHVITTPDPYFGPDGNPWAAFAIWNGGLGIWGAVALGAVGAWIGMRRRGLRLAPFADALAPGLLVAQAIGRLGNYFNQELYGAPTTLPWGLEIDDAHLVPGYASGTLFHPTFLYELVWNLAMVAVLLWAERRFRLGHGRVFWLYVMLYTVGRVWIEYLRIDTAEIVLGLRLNVWTSILIFLVALAFFVVIGRRTRGQEEESLWLPGREPAAAEGGGTAVDDADRAAETPAATRGEAESGAMTVSEAGSGTASAYTGEPAMPGPRTPEPASASSPEEGTESGSETDTASPSGRA
ncbi:prolipoprotein diacylglyceryl transferase [Georgenia yuyongxinii]|uniref:Phosphatidylglycerol--prolipoprotein diacylglyceryl transferase n=1 Tax=Georgenia yuyongxinii TaxID=2589797 RepID=A0A552WTU7_9MICO|nr:prolipoprotein diacylglyceryl transferase [Georgenia yuyongxinii]TRW46194.1 prolipoprotein diacylglyceryl transferase [Georgenia yuyongxinii]